MIGILALAVTLAQSSPAETAVPAPPAATVSKSEDGFQTGVDTINTVVAKLGRPNSTENNSDGTVTIRYARVRTHIKGASFVPIVGLFAGGATGTTTTKSFTFGSDGLLKSYASGDYRADCSTFGGCK